MMVYTGLNPVRVLTLLALTYVLSAVLADETGTETGESETHEITDDSLQLLKSSVEREVNANPELYDDIDVKNFFEGDFGPTATNFLIQRKGDWKKAYKLAIQTLRWRNENKVSTSQASDFPCDLFSVGLIFEAGNTRPVVQANAESPSPEPVIWLRLAALGSVIKSEEKLTPGRLARYTANKVRRLASKSRYLFSRSRRHGQVEQRSVRTTPKHDDGSVARDITIQHVLRSIAWWINNWINERGSSARASLVLDLEDTNYVYSSSTVSDFLIKLDDRFPNVFDQIIIYRYKLASWSVHTPFSMVNHLRKTHLSSSLTTFKKLRLARKEKSISYYIPRVTHEGKSLLPEYVSGQCVGQIYPRPTGCAEDTAKLAEAGEFDNRLWTAIYNEFYQLCKPTT